MPYCQRWIRALFLSLLTFLFTLPATAQQTLTRVEGRPPAAAFSLQEIGGGKMSLSDFHGKVLVINFWATNCAPAGRKCHLWSGRLNGLGDLTVG